MLRNMEGVVNLTKLLRKIQSVDHLAYPDHYLKQPDKLGAQLTPLSEAYHTIPRE